MTIEKKNVMSRVDSHAAVSNARSILKGNRNNTYDEMIDKSPFHIRPAREFLDKLSCSLADHTIT